jgi:hypothetical protein
MKRFLLICLLATAVAYTGVAQTTRLLNFFVESGSFQRLNTPVSLSLEGLCVSDTLSFQLFEKINGKLIEKPFQVEQSYTPVLWWILDGTTPAGKTREFILCRTESNSFGTRVTAEVKPDDIVLKNGSAEVLHYRTATMYPPAGVDTAFKRSGFIHPLFSPSGNILTRVSPPDHYHHVGIWNPWTKVKIGGHVTDFWNLGDKQGTVRFAGINSVISGPVFGGFSVRQEHIDFRSRKQGEVAINEVWDVRTWNSEPVPGLKAWLVDLTTFLSVAGDSSIIFEAYRYGGGIGIRANGEWTKENSTVLTSKGKTRKDADGTRARWTNINGAFSNNSQSGIVFLSHPSNREHPEPMRVWPEDANNNRGDVYFEFCPIRYKEWILNPGKVYMLKYRMLVYDGKIDK